MGAEQWMVTDQHDELVEDGFDSQDQAEAWIAKQAGWLAQHPAVRYSARRDDAAEDYEAQGGLAR